MYCIAEWTSEFIMLTRHFLAHKGHFFQLHSHRMMFYLVIIKPYNLHSFTRLKRVKESATEA